ncbi:unnamed protein product [Owenia fusiformis]|uniref:Uncharacterized protein n=1 Tax=Owenia fusiformis TaxID=6347 RepID=A0A8S4PLZ0_OWEFU|nr:unnamed protein product [Owenia fusiformis]
MPANQSVVEMTPGTSSKMNIAQHLGNVEQIRLEKQLKYLNKQEVIYERKATKEIGKLTRGLTDLKLAKRESTFSSISDSKHMDVKNKVVKRDRIKLTSCNNIGNESRDHYGRTSPTFITTGAAVSSPHSSIKTKENISSNSNQSIKTITNDTRDPFPTSTKTYKRVSRSLEELNMRRSLTFTAKGDIANVDVRLTRSKSKATFVNTVTPGHVYLTRRKCLTPPPIGGLKEIL